MVNVSQKIRADGFIDIVVEWPGRVDNVQLRYDLMNIGLGQYTYLGENSFQFRASQDFSLISFAERANEIYCKYSAFPRFIQVDKLGYSDSIVL